jgi:hypothetical protein
MNVLLVQIKWSNAHEKSSSGQHGLLCVQNEALFFDRGRFFRNECSSPPHYQHCSGNKDRPSGSPGKATARLID